MFQTQATIIDVEQEAKSSSTDDEPEIIATTSKMKKKIADDSYDDDIQAIQLVNQFEFSKKNQFIPLKTEQTSVSSGSIFTEEFKKPLVISNPVKVAEPNPTEFKFVAPKLEAPQVTMSFGTGVVDDDVDDEEFNKWLVDDTLMENSTSAIDISAKIEPKPSLEPAKPVIESTAPVNQSRLDPKNLSNLIKVDKSTIKVENPPQVSLKPDVCTFSSVLIQPVSLV